MAVIPEFLAKENNQFPITHSTHHLMTMNRRNFIRAIGSFVALIISKPVAAFEVRPPPQTSKKPLTQSRISLSTRKRSIIIGRKLVNDPSPNFTELANLTNSLPQSDVMATLFTVFKESIEQSNADKQYFLKKLSDMNRIAEAMGDYLKELNKVAPSTKDEPCSPQEAVATTYKIEVKLKEVERRLNTTSKRELAARKIDYRRLSKILARDKAILYEARKHYQKQ